MEDVITTNGARDVVCFHCRHAIQRSSVTVPREGGGFHHQYSCSKGLPMPSSSPDISDADIVSACPGGAPTEGFQIGGYYSHMWFESENNSPDDCLTWVIGSDGEFPTIEKEKRIELHVCDFRQIERFVAFWGRELRKRGVITDSASAN